MLFGTNIDENKTAVIIPAISVGDVLSHRKISREPITKIKGALSKLCSISPNIPLNISSQSEVELQDENPKMSQESSRRGWGWSGISVTSTIESSVEVFPDGPRGSHYPQSQVSTIVTQTTNKGTPTPEVIVPWRSCTRDDRAYNMWVAEERLQAALKRRSMSNTFQSGNKMSAFNIPHSSSMNSLHTAPEAAGQKELQEYAVYRARGSFTPARTIRTAQSIRDDALKFPTTRPTVYNQTNNEIREVSETQHILPTYPKLITASQVKLALIGSLDCIQTIQTEEMSRRCLPNNISRHIEGISRFAATESMPDIADSTISVIDNMITGMSLSSALKNTTSDSDTSSICESPRGWFGGPSPDAFMPTSSLGFTSEYGSFRSPLLQTRRRPQRGILNAEREKNLTSTGFFGIDGMGGIGGGDEQIGLITTEKVIIAATPEPRARKVTFLKRVCKWLRGGC